MLLARRLAGTSFSVQDRALTTELVYGTLAWQGRLDRHLAQLVHRPIDALDPPVRAALRMGLYQLLFLDRVPAYAAVDASVRLARRGGGLVNAVLRRAARLGREGLALPEEGSDPLDRLAIEWSHPRWLVERLAAQVGVDGAARAARRAQQARTGRAPRHQAERRGVSPRELYAQGARIAPGRWAPEALARRATAARLRTCAAYRAGRFVFQGEPSQLVTRLLGIEPGDTVLDACAAPGGKTVHAAALAGPSGSVVALDLTAAASRRIVAETARLGVAPRTVVADARRPPLRRAFDAVLVDAPCSGLGTLRRHPELRWRRRPEDICRGSPSYSASCSPAWRSSCDPVACWSTPCAARCAEETDDVIAGFLATQPGFARESVVPCLPSAAVPLASADGALRTWPHRHDVDAFFAVRLRAR